MQHVSHDEWDACAAPPGAELNPFVLHDLLSVLETSGSAVKEEGWLPQHVLVRRTDTGELLGCCPMYLKAHSFGEAGVGVGGGAWQDAWQAAISAPCGQLPASSPRFPHPPTHPPMPQASICLT